MSIDELVAKIIPSAVIFAEEPEHVADLRRRAKEAIEKWLDASADQFWDADDPEACDDSVENLAVQNDWSHAEVYEVWRSSRLGNVFAVPVNDGDEDGMTVRTFATREEAAVFSKGLRGEGLD